MLSFERPARCQSGAIFRGTYAGCKIHLCRERSGCNNEASSAARNLEGGLYVLQESDTRSGSIGASRVGRGTVAARERPRGNPQLDLAIRRARSFAWT